MVEKLSTTIVQLLSSRISGRKNAFLRGTAVIKHELEHGMEMSLEDKENLGENLLFGDGDAMYMITTIL